MQSPRGQWVNWLWPMALWQHIDGLVQERRNSSALAMELCLSCINPSIWHRRPQSTKVQVMSCHLVSVKPLHEPMLIYCQLDQTSTRTTRMPSFWDTPTPTWLSILVIHIRSHVKTRQIQSYKFLKIAKNSNFEILQENLHATHLLKFPDKLYKYPMSPINK